MSRSSSIPAALDAIVAAAKGSAELRDAIVVDGPPTSDFELPVRALIVGGSEDPDDPVAATGSRDEHGLQPQDAEQFDVHCDAVAWDGGPDATLSSTRRAAFALVDGLSAVLSRNPTLDGVVTRAAVVDERSVGQLRTEDGVGVAVRFTVRCTRV